MQLLKSLKYLKMVKYLMIFHLSPSKGLFLSFILFESNYDVSGGNSKETWSTMFLLVVPNNKYNPMYPFNSLSCPPVKKTLTL